ncbi:YraN family protein [Nitratiruptor tergarcus]|uniref:UPF0102 protein SAMN05660197_0108 n=1 Tax=Nitratiruptor tergarcus DSM 16512 TaxID=1069081 RepID=A0A1W1WQ72_9BACT|nr:YraN family protein [Nitratiruptor tergarcus]SMC08359.1 putative endonuclease [Nitratiruptor tergarcus DSM 16512]
MGLESYKRGREGEERAAAFLIEKGFTILERNFHSRFGEIDIIAMKDEILHFIEVKYSPKNDAEYFITPQKITKFVKTIDYYLLRKRWQGMYQMDAIIIKGEKISYLENISIWG